MARASRDFSPKTVLETRGFIERSIKPALGAVPLNKLRTADIDRFYLRLQGPGGGRSGRPLAPGTVRRIHGILRRTLEQGMRWGRLGVNPAAHASPPRVPKSNISPPGPNDVAKLFALALQRDPEFALFIILAAGTGARRSELLAPEVTPAEAAKVLGVTRQFVDRRRDRAYVDANELFPSL